VSLPNTVSSLRGPRDWAQIVLLTGGRCQSYAAASAADVTIVLDADREVARIRDRSGLIKVSLGGNDAALTLLARLPDDRCAEMVRGDYETRPNVFLGEGMAQDPRPGALAARDFIKSGWRGEVNGNPWGMGPGGAHEFGRFLIDEIEGRTRATARHHQVRLGGLGYIAVAPRAVRNTARSIPRTSSVCWRLIPCREFETQHLWNCPCATKSAVLSWGRQLSARVPEQHFLSGSAPRRAQPTPGRARNEREEHPRTRRVQPHRGWLDGTGQPGRDRRGWLTYPRFTDPVLRSPLRSNRGLNSGR
jgi:hypothetical protein